MRELRFNERLDDAFPVLLERCASKAREWPSRVGIAAQLDVNTRNGLDLSWSLDPPSGIILMSSSLSVVLYIAFSGIPLSIPVTRDAIEAILEVRTGGIEYEEPLPVPLEAVLVCIDFLTLHELAHLDLRHTGKDRKPAREFAADRFAVSALLNSEDETRIMRALASALPTLFHYAPDGGRSHPPNSERLAAILAMLS